MSYIHHVTLNTGHIRRAYREEIGDAAIAVVGELIDRSLALGRIPLDPAPLSHHAIQAVADRGLLIVTIFGPRGPHIPGRPASDAIPIATIGVARRGRQGRALWTMLAAQLGEAVGQPPTAPWVGVVLYPAANMFRDALAWLGDLERTIGWTWIDRTMD